MTEKLELFGKYQSVHDKNASMSITSKLEINDRLESLRKEIETFQQRNKRYKEEKVEILEPKNTITKIKSSMIGLIAWRKRHRKESVNWKTVQSEQQRQNRGGNEQSLGYLWDYNRKSNIRVIRISGEKKEGRVEEENVPKLSNLVRIYTYKCRKLS